jgi:Lon protease-like protein
MSEFLPLFPLNTVVFPGEHLNLHIFEPRYKQLIHDCQQTQSNFGIPYYQNGVQDFGTEIKIIEISRLYDNGEMDIKTIGQRAFELITFFPKREDKLYAYGEVSFRNENLSEDQTIRTKILDYAQQLFQITGSDVDKLKNKDNTPLSYLLGHLIALNKEQEFELLKIDNESVRQHYILNHLNTVLPLVEELENLKHRIKLNGHFKSLSL